MAGCADDLPLGDAMTACDPLRFGFRCSYSLLPGARTTVPVNVLPLRPEYTGGPSAMSVNATKSVMSPLAVKKPSKQKKLKSSWTNCSWRCLTYALAIALVFCLAVICFLLGKMIERFTSRNCRCFVLEYHSIRCRFFLPSNESSNMELCINFRLHVFKVCS